MTYTQALDALATMYRYRAMYRTFADIARREGDEEQAKVYAALAQKGSSKIRKAEVHTLALTPVDALGLVDQSEIIRVSLKASHEGEIAALREHEASFA